MTSTANPFMGRTTAAPAAPVERLDDDPILGDQVVHVGPQQPPMTGPDVAGVVPHVTVTAAAPLWLYRLHGGCGSSTLAGLLREPARLPPAEVEAWPTTATATRLPVVLVARTHAVGLAAARAALGQWGGAGLPPAARLVGVVLVADSPQPAALPDEVRALAAMAPRLWHVGWVDRWRCLLPGDDRPLSLRLRRTVQTIRQSAVEATTRRDPR